ncbi:MAG TPA: hypothetical protein VMX97_16355 [Hyphomicrobiaceae bacterium]|nr:hypothetical protein [Hyphomicrobiaceae bacterium]
MSISSHSRQSGMILVSVLWVVAGLSLLVSTFNQSVRTNGAVTRTELALAQVEAMTMAGVELAAAGLLIQGDGRWQPDGRLYTAKFSGADLTIQIFDANGFVDLNLAKDELMLAVFSGVTEAPGLASQLVGHILRKRQEAKANVARTDRQALEIRGNDPVAERPAFRDVWELSQVPGINHEQLARLRAVVTVHGRAAGINPRTATAGILRFVPGLTSTDLERLMASRSANGAAERVAADLPEAARALLSDQEGPAYLVKVTVRTPGLPAPFVQSVEILIASNLNGAKDRKITGAPYHVLTRHPRGT